MTSIETHADSRSDAAGETPAQVRPAQDLRPDAGSAMALRSTSDRRWFRLVAFVVLPGLTMLLAAGIGYLKWQADSVRAAQSASVESLSAATETTAAMLSYRPATVEEDLTAVQDRLTGAFRAEYMTLIHDVVIPGARDKQIAALASVPAAAVVSATADRTVVLVYINQTTTFDDGPPTFNASTARIALEKDQDRWLISEFSPI